MSQISILALEASPEKGQNSDTLLDHFLKGVKEKNPDIVIDKYYLHDVPMEAYNHTCSKGPQEGEEIFAEVVEKLQSAQGLVIGTPTYNFNVPSPLKNFIDRIGYVSLEYGKKNLLGQPPGRLGYLKTFFVVTGGTPASIRRCIFFLYPGFWLSVIFRYYYARNTGSLYGGNLTFRHQAKDEPRLMKKAKKQGSKFAKRLK